jgi:hypothetical protein
MGGGPQPGRTVDRGPVAAVWGPSDGDDVAVEEKLGGNNTQASGEGEKSGGGCGENRWRSLPFIGVVRR